MERDLKVQKSFLRTGLEITRLQKKITTQLLTLHETLTVGQLMSADIARIGHSCYCQILMTSLDQDK